MYDDSTPSLIQRWFVAIDERGDQRLLARWVDDSATSDAAGIA